MNPHQEILNEWLKKLEKGDEESVDSYLAKVLSSREEAGLTGDGYQRVFYPNQLLGCILSFSYTQMKGHLELTQEVVKGSCGNIITSPTAITNLARASRLPDLLYFDQVLYHALSEAGPSGELKSRNGIGDRQEFAKFLRQQLGELDRAIESKNIHDIFFYSGVLFHAVQDLACHQGMTNPEHAYCNKHSSDNPDLQPLRYEFAILVNTRFVEKFLRGRLEEVATSLNEFPNIAWKECCTVSNLLKLLRGAIKFNLSAIEERTESNTARWFTWRHSNDNQKALQEIEQNIFSSISVPPHESGKME